MTKDSRIIFFIASFLLFSCLIGICNAKESERFYQNQWCIDNDGKTEHLLPDLTRVDCLTKTHAIEFDFEKKWAEPIGQSLYYAAMTGKRAGIVLIISGTREYYLGRIQTVIEAYRLPIDIWTVQE